MPWEIRPASSIVRAVLSSNRSSGGSRRIASPCSSLPAEEAVATRVLRANESYTEVPGHAVEHLIWPARFRQVIVHPGSEHDVALILEVGYRQRCDFHMVRASGETPRVCQLASQPVHDGHSV